MEQLKKWIKITVGVGLVLGAAFGISDYTLGEPLNTVVSLIAALLVALYQRKQSAP